MNYLEYSSYSHWPCASHSIHPSFYLSIYLNLYVSLPSQDLRLFAEEEEIRKQCRRDVRKQLESKQGLVRCMMDAGSGSLKGSLRNVFSSVDFSDDEEEDNGVSSRRSTPRAGAASSPRGGGGGSRQGSKRGKERMEEEEKHMRDETQEEGQGQMQRVPSAEFMAEV